MVVMMKERRCNIKHKTFYCLSYLPAAPPPQNFLWVVFWEGGRRRNVEVVFIDDVDAGILVMGCFREKKGFGME